ncbi:hypothetical protein NB622_05590 [Vibrio parahaemolyticus]|uniref:hypothetical protein n=1 Tax=Vibrio parahaemolyticus TaxID=670 RepID=UPI001A3185CE|nr:hypothetical protein [Vibrio parahaemolyticus]EGQ7798584.1 hypothetical protein [Vibrio parahaemolyticus]EGQ8198886.1 hypothetical protein [Vibrio parahaemolyticus]EGU0149787.1 hypothetical protein [Vibrio parahaemolyticus]ELA9722197.1 hypothetical protein [Vibrio parahaemolyticus]MBY4624596.1 hypothetical protein [Vibrio parahaemolyticus]
MTAEVAVYNKSAVALAADSAATISNGRMQKIYNNAEKLFALTKYHPVGVMVFGAGDFVETPWELVIKSYRKHLGCTSFPTLKGYVDDFLSFIPQFITQKIPLNFDAYLTSVVFGFYEYIECNSEPGKDTKEKLEHLVSTMELETESLVGEQSVYLDQFSSKDVAPTEKKLRPIINSLINQLELDDLPKTLISKFRKSFLKFSVYALLKDHNFDVSTSGLVFAGYGEEDFFPQIYTFDVRGLFLDRLRSVLIEDKCASPGEAGIIPFAQQSEVESFMQGITDDHVRSCLNNTDELVTDTFVEFVEILEELEGVDEALKSKLTKRMAHSLFQNSKRLSKTFLDNIRNNHIDKIVSMIEHLPKNELSYMAESLVNLTAFKRKVSNETDTVGGPIDVAVISKGDGFVWIKRKHYFPGELNREHHLQKCQ